MELPSQIRVSTRSKRWFHGLALAYEERHGPLPDVVATAGAHLVPQPNSPVISPMNSECWAQTLHEKLDLVKGLEFFRGKMYGRDVAREWPTSHTPQEIRDEWWERAQRARAEIGNLPPTPEDERGLGYIPDDGVVAKRGSAPTRGPETGGSRSISKAVKQQPSPPPDQSESHRSIASGKKRKVRSLDLGEEDGAPSLRKRKRVKEPETVLVSPRRDENSSRARQSPAKMTSATAVGGVPHLEQSRTGQLDTDTLLSEGTTKHSPLKRKRTEETGLTSTSPERESDSDAPAAKRKHIDVFQDKNETSETQNGSISMNRKQEETPVAESTSSATTQNSSRAEQILKLQRTLDISSELAETLYEKKLARAKTREALFARIKTAPSKESLPSSRTNDEHAEKHAAFRSSNKVNKPLRSRPKQLAKTGIAT